MNRTPRYTDTNSILAVMCSSLKALQRVISPGVWAQRFLCTLPEELRLRKLVPPLDSLVKLYFHILAFTLVRFGTIPAVFLHINFLLLLLLRHAKQFPLLIFNGLLHSTPSIRFGFLSPLVFWGVNRINCSRNGGLQ